MQIVNPAASFYHGRSHILTSFFLRSHGRIPNSDTRFPSVFHSGFTRMSVSHVDSRTRCVGVVVFVVVVVAGVGSGEEGVGGMCSGWTHLARQAIDEPR